MATPESTQSSVTVADWREKFRFVVLRCKRNTAIFLFYENLFNIFDSNIDMNKEIYAIL